LASAALNAVTCLSVAWCMAVGYYNADRWLAEVWNGTSWTVEPAPAVPPLKINAISCTSPAACTAVGDQIASPHYLLAGRWDGTGWTLQHPAPPPADTLGQFTGVSCASATACTAVGYYVTATNTAGPIVQAWDGTNWVSEQAPTTPFTKLMAVSCTAAAMCTAVGLQQPGRSFKPLALRSH
jgi:hypothetical protein